MSRHEAGTQAASAVTIKSILVGSQGYPDGEATAPTGDSLKVQPSPVAVTKIAGNGQAQSHALREAAAGLPR